MDKTVPHPHVTTKSSKIAIFLLPNNVLIEVTRQHFGTRKLHDGATKRLKYFNTFLRFDVTLETFGQTEGRSDVQTDRYRKRQT